MAIYINGTRIDTGGNSAILKSDGEGKKFLADNGTYNKLINDTASKSEDTVYSAKRTEERLEEVQNALVAGQDSRVNMWQKTTLNAVAGTPISYTTDDENSIDNIVVQCYKFIPGQENIVQVLKNFNNGEEENFYHTDNVEFNGVAKIKDTYILENTLNEDALYESEIINKDEFVFLNSIGVMA